MKAKTNPDQLSLFDFLPDADKKPSTVLAEPPILYHKGDRLYHQQQGDVEPCRIDGEYSWIAHNTRFYRVKYDIGIFGIVNNESTDFFKNEEDAKKAAEIWMSSKDVIRKEEIVFENAEIFVDAQKQNYAVLLPLKKNLLYLKVPSLYTHAVKDNKKNRKAFYDRVQSFHLQKSSDINFPEPENLYRCQGVTDEETEWLYASYGYRMATG